MGGNALKMKGVDTRRYEDNEYKELCSEVKNKLELLLPTNKFHIIQAYRNKKDHGDMDIVICCSHKDNFNSIIEKVVECFNPSAVNKNDTVFSFEYKDFQIDLIYSLVDYFEYQCSGMNYDPSLNLMGKTYYRQMTSFKHKGLYFVYRNFNGRVSKDILLTRDMRKTFEFGGFDYDRYLKGFDDLVEIFDFIIESENFNFECFKLENLNQMNRKRNKKRPTFNMFIEYCNGKNDETYNIDSDRSELYEGKNTIQNFEQKDNREECINKIDKFFPDVDIYSKIKALDVKYESVKEMHSKFNGKLVMLKLPNLKGVELGKAMGNFQKSFDDYSEYILSNTTEQIMEDFIKTLT